MLHNLKILCCLWVVLCNIPSILLLRFSFFCLSIDMSTKCEERAFVIECINCINPYALFGMFQPELSRGAALGRAHTNLAKLLLAKALLQKRAFFC